MAERWWAALGAQVSPRALRDLFRSKPATMRTWLRHVRAVDEALGSDAARAYSQLVLAASADEIVAGQLAVALPDLIAAVAPGDRRRFQRLMVGVLEQRPSAALLVARNLSKLLASMDDAAIALFVAEALERHIESPRRAEGFLRMESVAGREAVDAAQGGVTLRSMHRALTMYARAHCGSAVAIRPGGDDAFTDGRHLYLPVRLNHFGDERDETAYWALTAAAAGFIEFGSLDIDLDKIDGPWPEPRADEMPFERMVRGFDNPVLARTLFLLFERERVEARVRSTYPGVARRMDALGPVLKHSTEWSKTPVDQVLGAVAAALDGQSLPPGNVGAIASKVVGALEPARFASVSDSVSAMVDGYPHIRELMTNATDAVSVPELGFNPQAMTDSDKAVEAAAAELLRNLSEPSDLATVRARVSEDRDGASFAEMSDFLDRLEAPSGPLTSEDEGTSGGSTPEANPDPDSVGAVLTRRYPEWDDSLQEYKPNWVTVREYRLVEGKADFVDDVMAEHGAMIATLRRTFEALRPQSMRPKRGLSDGEELDMDAVLEARMAHRVGAAGPSGLYRSRQRTERDVSVAFLIDMSSSTNEHINTASKRIIDVEREALVVTAEAINALGDPMAIYGYSGFGREQVAFYVAKDFDEQWGPRIRERIGRISWKMENRDGAAIRHATAKLSLAPGKVKLLILLSDGKPLDCGCDQYSDEYAQEDTRMALIEARKAGVHPFCITVDPHGRSYLRRIYGDGGYAIIDSVGALPVQLPTIYRRLTRR